MQFELFEKLSSSNKFQIELEKSYDYFLMIYMKKKKPFWLCLNAFCSRLDLHVQLLLSGFTNKNLLQGAELPVPNKI